MGIMLAVLLGLTVVAAQPPPTQQPKISVNDMAVTEGDAGTIEAVFTVSLSPATKKRVTVDYATTDGSATAGGDYESTSGTLVFAGDETSKPVTVLVQGDTAQNAVIDKGTGAGTIRNDAAPPADRKDGMEGMMEDVCVFLGADPFFTTLWQAARVYDAGEDVKKLCLQTVPPTFRDQ